MLMDLPLSEGYKVRGLFIENSPIFRRWVSELLSSKIELVEAEDFTQALGILDSPVYVDFVLIDWEMLDTAGIEVLYDLRKRYLKPIVLLAGRKLSQEEFERAVNSGVVECLFKDEIKKRLEEMEESHPTFRGVTQTPLSATVIDAVATEVSKDMQDSFRAFDRVLLKLKE